MASKSILLLATVMVLALNTQAYPTEDNNKLIVLTAPASMPVSKREAGGFYTTRFGKRSGFRAAGELPVASNMDDTHLQLQACLKALLTDDQENVPSETMVCSRSKDDNDVFVCRNRQ